MKHSIQSEPFALDLVRPLAELQHLKKLHIDIAETDTLAAHHGSENLYAKDWTGTGIHSSANTALVNRVMTSGAREQRHLLCRGGAPGSGPAGPARPCRHLHRGDPFLRLGPARLEVAATEPFIGLLHGLHSTVQAREVRAGARGRMKATPLTVAGRVEAYTGRRSSKVVYQSEALSPVLAAMSRTTERVTGLRLTGEKFASENWQVMNYGLGGTIRVHTDVQVDMKPWDDDDLFGGQRLLTYMVYLSSARGGRTVFTAKRVSIQPVEGDVVLWFNIQSDGGFDSRAFHTGCPVVEGSKWIANKWARSRSQMWNFPCLR
jgi:prolyl 4-hydroxylase